MKEDEVRDDRGVTAVISALGNPLLGGKCQKLKSLLGLSNVHYDVVVTKILMTHHLKIFSKRSDGKEEHFPSEPGVRMCLRK